MHAESFEVIVIGVGSMGSATCFNLAERGIRVLGLEQFTSPHEKGSHSGQSRIIRKAYFEHEDYVPLLDRAYQLWREFEQRLSTTLFYKTGIVYAGLPRNENIAGIISSAERYQIPIEQLSADASTKRFAQLSIPENFKTIFEPDAGFITPERAINAYIQEAQQSGATIRQNEGVVGWDYVNGQFQIKTTKGRYKSPKLIITAGSWTASLLPQVSMRMKVTEQFLYWVPANDAAQFSLGNFPCWFIEDPDLGTFYGFPILPSEKFNGPSGFKIAHHAAGEKVNPDHRFEHDPTVYFQKVKTAIEKYFPGIKPEIVDSRSCLYTYSPDSHFIIDHLPGFDGNLTIACGFSGHGFKFVPVVGEILSQLAIEGHTNHPIDFLRLNRF